MPDPKHPSIRNLHKTVILDQSLTEEDVDSAIKAMHEWECATNHMVQFEIVKYPSEQELADITDLDHSVIIKNVQADDPRINKQNEKMAPGIHTVAIYEAYRSQLPDILIAKIFLVQHSNEYEIYVEHELGHSLGLDHIENSLAHDIPIMDPIPSRSRGITDEDLLALAELYGIPFALMHTC